MIEVLLVLIECNFFVEKSTTLFSRLMVMTLKRRKLFRRILWWWEECPIIKTKYSERTRWGNNKYLRAATTVSLCNNQIFFGKKKNILLKENFHHIKTYKMIPLAFPMLQKSIFSGNAQDQAWVHDIMLMISSSMYVSKHCEMEHLHFTTSNLNMRQKL